MIWQTAMDAVSAAETVFRSVRSSLTKTSTVTIAAGTPVVLETATASADGSFVMQALTATSVVNHLYVGNANAALPPDSVGLAQCYGIDSDAVVATAGATVGVQLRPNIATLASVGSSTDGCLAVTGGGANVLTVLVGTSGAAQAASPVFIRAL